MTEKRSRLFGSFSQWAELALCAALGFALVFFAIQRAGFEISETHSTASSPLTDAFADENKPHSPNPTNRDGQTPQA